MSKVLEWFTAARRAALYTVALAILPMLSRVGIIPDGDVEAWTIVVQAALQVLAGVLMLANLSFADAATWFARGGRAAIYSLGAFVAPALTALGFLTSTQAEYWLQLLADVLSIIAALVAALYITPTRASAPDEVGEASIGRVTGAAVVAVVAALVIAAVMVFFGPSAKADCVYSGGGWICAGSQPPSEPGEPIVATPAPTVVVVEETPAVEPAAPALEPVVPVIPAPAEPVEFDAPLSCG